MIFYANQHFFKNLLLIFSLILEYSSLSTVSASFKHNIISGDSQNNWSSDGAQNEPVALQPTQHAEGGPAYEQAKSPEHPETDGGMCSRRPAARPHGVHQWRLVRTAYTEQVH